MGKSHWHRPEGLRTKSPVVVSIVIGILLVIILCPPVARAGVNVAVWSSGDAWEWRGALGASGPAVLTAVVLGEESDFFSGVFYQSYHVRLWNNLTSGAPNSSMIGDAWYRASDLTVLKSIIQGNVSSTGVANHTDTITYDPPLPMEFPLIANNTWIATTTATLVTISETHPTTWENTTLTMTTKIGPPVQYTVLAGTFMTTPINETISGQGTSVYYWSGDAGNSLTGPLIAPGVLAFGSMNLASFHYTPPSLSSSAPAVDPLWLFAGGLAVGAGTVGLVAAILVRHYRAARPPGVQNQGLLPERPKP